MIQKVQLLRGADRGLVFLEDVADAARELQERGIVFNDAVNDMCLARGSRRGAIAPTRWVADADCGSIEWTWHGRVRNALQSLAAA